MNLPVSTLLLILFFATSLTLLVTNNWHWSIAALGIQYIGILILVAQEWPLGLAAIKLVVGWMAAAVLGLTQMERKGAGDQSSSLFPSGYMFRGLAAVFVLLVILSISPKVSGWFPGVPLSTTQAGLELIGVGLLQLGMTSRPYQVTLGLLTLLGGFEVLYAGVESSILVAGLLALINLGLSLAGSYLILLTPEGETL